MAECWCRTWHGKAKGDAMIEDIDICVGFQHSVDESALGHKDGDTGETGEGDGNIADWGETLHF